ncbi:MAG: hypothetical protein ACREJ2_02955 [Planctomycetota bacterium]
MTGGKVTLLIVNGIFAAVLIVLLGLDTTKSVDLSQKKAAILANQAHLKGLVNEYKYLLNNVVGVQVDPTSQDALTQKSKDGIFVFRYAAQYGTVNGGSDDGPILASEAQWVDSTDVQQGKPIPMPEWKTGDDKKPVVELTPTVIQPHLLFSQDLAAREMAGVVPSPTIPSLKQDYEVDETEAAKRRQAFDDATNDVWNTWKHLPEINKAAAQDMRSKLTDWQQDQENHLASEAGLYNEIYRKKTSLVRMKIDHEKQQAEWSHQENDMSNKIEEVSNHTLNKALRQTRSNELQADGTVLDASDPSMGIVTIDIGRRNNCREGLVFTVYNTFSGQNQIKGSIQVVKVFETTSTCKIIHQPSEEFISDRTQFRTPDPRVEYDPLGSRKVAGQPELRPVPMRPYSPSSERQDVIDQLIPPKTEAYNANPQATGVLVPEYNTASTSPIEKGDLIASPDFEPVVSQREAAKRFYSELNDLRDVSLERLNFALMPGFSDNEIGYLQRSIESNGCVLHDTIQPRTNYLIVREPLSEYVATNAERLRFLIDTNTKSAQGLPDTSPVAQLAAKRAQILDTAQKYNIRVMTMDEATTFFQDRRRKADLLSGKLELGGRSMFYVSGQSETRSHDQIESFIREHNGLVANQLTDEVDWLVAGAGSEDDIDKAKKLGVRILREKDLDEFFAAPGSTDQQP